MYIVYFIFEKIRAIFIAFDKSYASIYYAEFLHIILLYIFSMRFEKDSIPFAKY